MDEERSDNSPLVSIVLPVHNGARYLRESVDSCLRQTHRNWELIVVNDGSTDETEEIVLSYRDPRIVYDRHHPNAGLPRSLNVGFALARGQYLTWTSDDNRYADEALEVMVAELERSAPRVQFVYADCHLIDETGQVTGLSEGKAPARLREENVVGACFLYTAAVAAAVGPYHPEVKLAEDYEYWLRVLYRFGMRRIPRPLYYYRQHGESLSARYGWPFVLQVARQARASARAGLPWYQRCWESTVRSPRLSVMQRRCVAAVEEALRPRRRLQQLREARDQRKAGGNGEG